MTRSTFTKLVGFALIMMITAGTGTRKVMRELTLKLMLAVAVLSLSLTTARAEVLSTVDVSAPAINCLFDPTCRVEVNDSTETLSIGAGGPNFLQSRTFRGKAGSPAAGLYVYEYRIDLRRAEGILHIPCVDSLSIDFNSMVRTLDLDGNGKRGDEVFVVTHGGLGSIGLASAEKSGNKITFNFSASVCAGGRPGEGASTFFFGLVSTHAPVQTTATILESTGRISKVYVRTPRQKDPLHDEIRQGVPVEKPVPIPNSDESAEANVDRSIPVQNRGEKSEGYVKKPIPFQNRGGARQESEIVIDHFRPQPCVELGTHVNIYGAGFGPRQARRYVVLGGHGISAALRVTAWRDGRITAIVSSYRRISQGQWYYIGLQNEDHQWISNISRTINICRGLE